MATLQARLVKYKLAEEEVMFRKAIEALARANAVESEPLGAKEFAEQILESERLVGPGTFRAWYSFPVTEDIRAHDPEGFTMPFGRFPGKALKDLDDKYLEGMLAWIEKKGLTEKHAETYGKIKAYLGARGEKT